MILLAVVAAAGIQSADSVRICIRDQRSDEPIRGVTVSSPQRAPRILGGDCGWVEAGLNTFRRIGYRPLDADVGLSSTIRLAPLHGSVVALDTQHVVALAESSRDPGTRVTISSGDARERGAFSTPQLAGLLPFTQLQSNRGAVSLSLRGARREQVIVTIDGIPLNDPATGLADVNEIPLSAISSATVAPGVSSLASVASSVGGELALQSSTQPVLAVQLGAFGARSMEAGTRVTVGRSLVHVGGSWSEADNNFEFRNTAGVFDVAPVEQRVNNDESKWALFGTMLHDGVRIAVMGSRSERGLVGPMNVRTYDNDRATTDRLLVDSRLQAGRLTLGARLRSFGLAYRDLTRPQLDNDSRAYAAIASFMRSSIETPSSRDIDSNVAQTISRDWNVRGRTRSPAASGASGR